MTSLVNSPRPPGLTQAPPTLWDPEDFDQSQDRVKVLGFLYLKARARSKHPAEALERMKIALLTPPIDQKLPHLDSVILRMLCAKFDWESAYNESLAARILPAADLGEAQDRVDEAIRIAKEARFVLALCFRELQESNNKNPARHNAALKSYTEALQSCETLARELQDQTALNQILQETRQNFLQVRSSLLDHYGHLGPAYQILADRTSSAFVRAQALEQAGRPIQAADYHEITRTLTSLIAQLQKYTEAQKTELVKQEVKDAVEKVLEIAEAHLRDTSPHLWLAIVTDVTRAVSMPAAPTSTPPTVEYVPGE